MTISSFGDKNVVHLGEQHREESEGCPCSEQTLSHLPARDSGSRDVAIALRVDLILSCAC